MRTDLIVNFKEKDKVKSLGAQWDRVKKVWYIEDVENIEQFLPWIPNNLKKPSGLIDSKKKFVKWKKTFGVVDVKLKDIK